MKLSLDLEREDAGLDLGAKWFAIIVAGPPLLIAGLLFAYAFYLANFAQ